MKKLISIHSCCDFADGCICLLQCEEFITVVRQTNGLSTATVGEIGTSGLELNSLWFFSNRSLNFSL